ncbi:hypothetical protein JHK82_029995 [Glycine max]|uniref:Uncharacterized protein n=2 Tax=Glycine subgen. Soja TaxID=1462606 RepID=A0A0R0HBJ8_SOYBN|nr:hypothetical protein JHK85_030616 [Glycine max]RZB78194.1 hypothetical protein D0Y65_028896 [Glycine soja]KAG4993255.1 hypothetical protein JHK86_030082 [Glycine max]KAG5123258.1 hypothetical protein JHK82_029995 [Glycine max]KAH1157478.1 hypothetical protein GYH30_029945 [Glycine max]
MDPWFLSYAPLVAKIHGFISYPMIGICCFHYTLREGKKGFLIAVLLFIFRISSPLLADAIGILFIRCFC